MKEKISEAFNALQGLDIKATPNNVSILDGVFEILRSIYQEMEEEENAAEVSGRDGD